MENKYIKNLRTNYKKMLVLLGSSFVLVEGVTYLLAGEVSGNMPFFASQKAHRVYIKEYTEDGIIESTKYMPNSFDDEYSINLKSAYYDFNTSTVQDVYDVTELFKRYNISPEGVIYNFSDNWIDNSQYYFKILKDKDKYYKDTVIVDGDTNYKDYYQFTLSKYSHNFDDEKSVDVNNPSTKYFLSFSAYTLMFSLVGALIGYKTLKSSEKMVKDAIKEKRK